MNIIPKSKNQWMFVLVGAVIIVALVYFKKITLPTKNS